MTTTTPDLEDRLRRGLRAAADALPPAPVDPPTLGTGSRRPPSRRGRRVAGLAAVAAVTLAGALVAARLVASGGGTADESPAVRSGGQGATTTTATTIAPDDVRVTNGMVPGRAVVVGPELRTYDAAGIQTGTVDVSRFRNIQSASSDLEGGWVVCGAREPTAEEVEQMRREVEDSGLSTDPDSFRPALREELVWYPAEGDPVVLDENMAMMCMASSVHVVDSPQGPTVINEHSDMSAPESGSAGTGLFSWRAIVLATGEERELDIPDTARDGNISRWSVTSERFLTHDGAGFHLYDLATGEELAAPPIVIDQPSDIVLSNDATSVAVITGSATGPSEVAVYDLASGAERFRQPLEMPTEGAELSYDGTTVAYGSYSDGNGGFEVVDLATGARHTIGGYGLVL